MTLPEELTATLSEHLVERRQGGVVPRRSAVGTSAYEIEVLQTRSRIGLTADSCLSIVEVELCQTEEGEVSIALVAIATVGTGAGDVAELMDIDPFIEVRDSGDLCRGSRCHKAALVGSLIRSEEVEKTLRSAVTLPATIDTHSDTRDCLRRTARRGVDEEGHTTPVLRLLTIVVDGEDDLRVAEVVVRQEEVRVGGVQAVLTRADDLLGVGSCIGIALRTRVDLGIEVETREQGPGSSLVGTTVVTGLRRLEVALDSLQLALDIVEELAAADLTRIDLTRRCGLVDEGRIAKEVDEHPVLIGTQEASFGAVGADRSIGGLRLGVLEEL